MALLNILHYPDQRLRQRSKPVAAITPEILQLIDDMFETMYSAPAIGLAAPQINIFKRIITIDITERRNNPICLINPEIINRQGLSRLSEGCLSVPGIFESIDRAQQIVFRALNKDGQCNELEVQGLLAVCIQHEIDHLEGKLFVDYLSELKRTRIRKKLEKQARHTI